MTVSIGLLTSCSSISAVVDQYKEVGGAVNHIIGLFTKILEVTIGNKEVCPAT